MARKKKEKEIVIERPEKIEIPNFGFLNVSYVSITLCEEGDQYGAALAFHSEIDTESKQTITAVHHELPILGTKAEIMRACVIGIVTLYGQESLLDYVAVFNTEGEQIDEISISSYNFDAPKKGRSFNLVNR